MAGRDWRLACGAGSAWLRSGSKSTRNGSSTEYAALPEIRREPKTYRLVPYRPRRSVGVGSLAIGPEGKMQIARIGDFEVHRVAEYEGPFIAPETFFPDFDRQAVEANPDHPGPRLIDRASGNLFFSFHSFVVKTGHHTILIDSCLGNDKERPTRPQFHRLRTSYVADLARGRCPGRGRRLCDVHASALGPCRLEYPARKRTLGSDLP